VFVVDHLLTSSFMVFDACLNSKPESCLFDLDEKDGDSIIYQILHLYSILRHRSNRSEPGQCSSQPMPSLCLYPHRNESSSILSILAVSQWYVPDKIE
jgi:hypothetical protein